MNTTSATQFTRELCVTNLSGSTPDPFLAERVDGKEERLTLNADDGPVIVSNLTVTIVGTT